MVTHGGATHTTRKLLITSGLLLTDLFPPKMVEYRQIYQRISLSNLPMDIFVGYPSLNDKRQLFRQ